jgi:hypothetical protein
MPGGRRLPTAKGAADLAMTADEATQMVTVGIRLPYWGGKGNFGFLPATTRYSERLSFIGPHRNRLTNSARSFLDRLDGS